MPGLGTFEGEFERTFARAGATEDTLLSGQEVARYELTSTDGTLVGELRVLYSPTLIAQSLEYLASAPGNVEDLAVAAQPFLPPDAVFVDDPLDEDEHLLRRYASISLADLPEMNTLSTDGDRDEPAEPGTITLEVTPTRWLIRPGDWSAALLDG